MPLTANFCNNLERERVKINIVFVNATIARAFTTSVPLFPKYTPYASAKGETEPCAFLIPIREIIEIVIKPYTRVAKDVDETIAFGISLLFLASSDN